MAQEERHLTSSEGENRGNTGRIQKLIKISVSYYRLHLALLGYTINITSFEKPKNILFAVSHQFVWNVLSFYSLIFFRFLGRMLAFISCATFCLRGFLPF